MANESPINGTIQSILTILVVCIFAPLLTGGSIGLAVYFGGEVEVMDTPEDVNGISVYNKDCPVSNPGQFTYSNPTIPHTNINSIDSNNFTQIIYSNGGLSNPPRMCNGNAVSDVNLSYLFPSSTFDFEESYSSFSWHMTRTNAYSSAYWVQETSFDFSLTINGTTIFEFEDYTVYGESSTTTRPSFDIEHIFTASEYNTLRTELNKCQDDCDIRFHIDNWQPSTCPQSYCATPIQQPTSVSLNLYSTDELSSDLVLTVAPWFFGILCSLIALGSTPYWDPIWKGANNMKDKMRERY